MEESEVKTWLVAAQQEQWDLHESLRPRIFAWVFRISFNILRSGAKAEEAAGDILSKLYLNRGKYDLAKPAKPWVRSVTVHFCLDILGGREDSFDFNDPRMRERFSKPPTELLTAMRKEIIAAVAGCWSNLTALEKAAMLARAFGETNEGIYGNRMHQATYKARNKLRECLKKAGHEFPESGKK